MFLSSRNNQFKFDFPRKFIPQPIVDKYKPFINKMPGGMIKEPIDLFNYGIQSINLPGPSFDPVQQNDFPGLTRNFRSAAPTQELFDKSLTVTMQSFDGFINYWMAIDIFDYYYSQSGKQPWLPEGVGIQMLDGEGNAFVLVQIKEMIMTGVGAMDLNFSSNTVDFQTFEITFVYNTLEIKYGNASSSPAGPPPIPKKVDTFGLAKLLDEAGNLLSEQRIAAGTVGELVAPNADVSNQAGSYTASILSNGSLTLPFAKIKNQLGQDIDVDYIPAIDGYIFEAIPCQDATITNQAEDYSLSIPSGNTTKLPFGKVKNKEGNDVQVDYLPAVDGYMFEETPCADATVELNGVVVAAPASGTTVNIPILQNGSPEGSWNGSEWVVPACNCTELSIAVDDATPDYNGTLTITATATGLTPTYYTFQISDAESGISTVTQVSNVLAWTVNKVGTVTISATATDGVDTTGSSTTVTVTDPLTYATKLADWNGKAGVTLVNGQVSDIADQSGNGYDIGTWTVGARPFYETSSGKVISQFSDMRNLTTNPLNGKAAFTIFFKATKFATAASNQRLIGFGSAGVQFTIGLSALVGDTNIGETNYTRYATFTSNIINGTTVAIIKNGTNPFVAYVNGVLATINSAVGTPQATLPTDNGIHLFSQNGGFKFTGMFDRIIIFDTASLTATQIAAITARINAIHT